MADHSIKAEERPPGPYAVRLLPSHYILKKSLELVNELIYTSALAWYLTRLNAPQIKAGDSGNSNSRSRSISSHHLNPPRPKSPHQEEWMNLSTSYLYFLFHTGAKGHNFSVLIICGMARDTAFEPSVIPLSHCYLPLLHSSLSSLSCYLHKIIFILSFFPLHLLPIYLITFAISNWDIPPELIQW